MIEGATGGARDLLPFDTREMAIDALTSGYADLVTFGKPIIANPDLVERLRRDAPLNALDADHLFGGGAEGYTD